MKTSRQSVVANLYRDKTIGALVENADYVGVKSVTSSKSFEPFLQDMFSYRPKLVRLLYRIRAPLVRLLGFKQEAMPAMDEWVPEEFPMYPCGNLWFFTVSHVEKDRLWIVGCPRDRHLDADLAIVAQPFAPGCRQFHILTVVRYKHWTGPVYFNLIRLFNLVLVDRMARFAAGPCSRS